MTPRSHYLNKAKACVDAAEKVGDPAERAALLRVSACYVLLSDYVAARQERGTAHRKDDHRTAQPDS